MGGVAAAFTFGGVSTYTPQTLTRTVIAQQNVGALLPFGKLFMAGASDGGQGGGTIYRGTLQQLQLVLRSGTLYNTLMKAVGIGPTSQIVVAVCGTKTSASYNFSTGSAQPFLIAITGTVTTSDSIVWTIMKNGGTVPVTGTVTCTAAETALEIATAVQASIQADITSGTLAGWTVSLTGTTLSFVAPEAADTVALDPSASTHVLVNTSNATTGALAVPHSEAIISAGDQGTWTDGIEFSLVTGTTTGFAFTVTWTDAFGNINTVGGLGTAFDNLVTFANLQAAILANGLLTPPSGSGLPPIIALTLGVGGSLAALSNTNLAGGTGSGSQTLVFTDFKKGIDAVITEAYDVGHLAACTDPATQAYLDEQTANVEIYGKLRRNVHQQLATGLSPTVSPEENSTTLRAFAVSAAQTLDQKRSILCVQKFYIPDVVTGVYEYQAAAPYYVGRLILDATTGSAGPATPSTFKPIPGAADIDYQILPDGDLDACIAAGVTVFERPGDVVPGGVRCVRSVTTAPLDANGQAWPFYEVSALRASDGVLASAKAEVDAAIGNAATVPLLVDLIGRIKDVLSNGISAGWITEYIPSSIAIIPGGGSGTGYLLNYSAAPTLPFNNAGITQQILPFQAQIASSGTVNG
jgi:hypothetical protein